MSTNETEMGMDTETAVDVKNRKEVLKIVGEVNVWSSGDWITPEYLQGLIADGESDRVVAMLSYSNADMTGYDGWARFGRAKVEVTLFPRDVIVENKVESLKAEIQKKRAETQKEVEKLEERIQQLLALPNPNKATNGVESEIDNVVETPMVAPNDHLCPQCGSDMIDKPSGGVECTNPECNYWFCF